MQNKQAIIGIVAAAVILLGAGGVFLYSKNKPAPQPSSTSTTTEQTKTQSSMNDSLSSLLKSGKTQQCTFSYDDQSGSTTDGVAYINGNLMRTDVNTTVDGKQSSVYVIRSGDENYIWGSAFPNNTGMKMTLSIEDYESNTDSKQYFDPTKKAEYDCRDWTPDSSVFTPPTNVKFQDFSAMMQAASSPSASNCSICNSLTGDAKNACLSQLGC